MKKKLHKKLYAINHREPYPIQFGLSIKPPGRLEKTIENDNAYIDLGVTE